MPGFCQTASPLHSILTFLANLANRLVIFCRRCSFIVIPRPRKALAATSKDGQRTAIDTQISISAGLIRFIIPSNSRPRCRRAPFCRFGDLPRFFFGCALRKTGDRTFLCRPDFNRIVISRYPRKRQAHWALHCFNIIRKKVLDRSALSLSIISHSAFSWYFSYTSCSYSTKSSVPKTEVIILFTVTTWSFRSCDLLWTILVYTSSNFRKSRRKGQTKISLTETLSLQ